MKKRFTVRGGQVESIIALVRVAELRSFRAAADELGVSVSAVSQVVRALEARAGVALLTRTTRTVALTDAGRRFLQRAQPAAEELLGAFASAQSSGKRVTGLLRLNVPRSVSHRLIEPLIVEFSALYPELEIEIFAQDANTNIVADGFDAGIRLGELVEGDMVPVRLTPPFKFAVVGSPAYFRRFGRPKMIEDLAQHRCIRFRKRSRDSVRPWVFQEAGRSLQSAVSGPLIVNDSQLALMTALRGLGLTQTPLPLAEPYLATGALECVLDEFCSQTPGMFLYYPHRRQVLPKLRAFIDFVRQRRREHPLS